MMMGITDVHTHILPAVDDGARDLQMACQMLTAEKCNGVDRVILTPHFYPQEEEASVFLQRRDEALTQLRAANLPEKMPEIRWGAEVRYCEFLGEMDVKPLTMAEGRYLLLELPGGNQPRRLTQTVDQLLSQDIIPVLAHIERCIYFRDTPKLLTDLIHMGALAQVSAHAVFDKRDKRFAMACLENGLAHIVASDAHNMDSRLPNLAQTMEKLPKDQVEAAEYFARCLWDNEPAPPFSVQTTEKGILGYR